ncbi:MAG: hypothetical protein M1814_005451 [Vezdaea aestivalis]|nr:MAG: hypothetical protein M1814_005451 [Vezdaea aestivalis]
MGGQYTYAPHSRQYGLGSFSNQRSQQPTFLVPSYLRESNYIERLSEWHRKQSEIQREKNASRGGTLSTSSSSANLQKLPQVHHGVNISVTERELAHNKNFLTPLPSRWSDTDKAPGITVQNEGLEASSAITSKALAINDHEALTIRANHFMPPQCGLYYYEVTISAKIKDNSMIGIGFCGPQTTLNRLPGWLNDSWAYHGDDGNAFCCNQLGKPYAEKFTTNDVIGCGLNFRTGCAFFTKNGLFLKNAFSGLQKKGPLYPTIGMKRLGEAVKANFGQYPFVFDIDGMMEREKAILAREINGTIANKLSPSLSETPLIQALVAQYLAHDGYVETARAFATEIACEAKDLHVQGYEDLKPYEAEEDLDAVNRQRIRGAIIEGDVDKALKHTEKHYPNVLRDNPQIYFRLRCRKFIEMMKQCSDLFSLSNQTPQKGSSWMTGSNRAYEGVFEHDMDVDDQFNGKGARDRFESKGQAAESQYNGLLQETLAYGQVLQFEFKDDQSTEVRNALMDTFHLMAYEDPNKSIVAHLMDSSGRIPVAEELNSAILVSLGKSSSACLERLCQQTEVLVSVMAEEGGPSALINITKEYFK